VAVKDYLANSVMFSSRPAFVKTSARQAGRNGNKAERMAQSVKEQYPMRFADGATQQGLSVDAPLTSARTRGQKG
jgi:hypothetical protein